MFVENNGWALQYVGSTPTTSTNLKLIQKFIFVLIAPDTEVFLFNVWFFIFYKKGY